MREHKLIIPARALTCIMGFLCTVFAYIFRQTLSYALTEIVSKPHENKTGEGICPQIADAYSSVDADLDGSKRFDWTQKEQGVVLSSFYWGYIATHIPAALLAQHIGGRDVAIIGTAICAIFTLLTPLAIVECGYYGLLFVRVMVGFGEGFVFPACSTLVAAWIPLKERSLAICAVYSGIKIGAFIGAIGCGELIAAFGWKSPFYLFGILSLVWCLATVFLCANNPESHRFISESEKNYLRRELGELKRRTDLQSTPWQEILTSVPVYAIIVAQIGHTWGLFIVITYLAKYAADVLRFNIKENGMYTSVPYLLAWFVIIGTGFLSDYLIKHKYLGISFSRKLFTTIAQVGPAIFMLLASYLGCARFGVISMFCLGMATMGTYFAGAKANCVDVAPNYAGVIMALANGSGGVVGIAVPLIVGELTPNSLLEEYRNAFWLTFGVMVSAALFYNVFGTAEIQSWNHTPGVVSEDKLDEIVSKIIY